jgi:predicted dehydrogenase
MQERRVALRWHQGDVLIVDNGLVMHARELFTPPRRVLTSFLGPPANIVMAMKKEGKRPKDFPEQGRPLRIGVIGTGMMGREHIRNVGLLGKDVAVITAISDSDSEARTLAVKELGAGISCAVYADDAGLLASDSVDAIIVATPNYLHIDVLRRAIPSDKHVLCEKPLCTTVADCEEVERLVAERDARRKLAGLSPIVFMTGMEYRWMPPIATLIEQTDSGRLGQLRMVSIREHRFPFLVKVANWNRFNRYTGGTLVEKACHFFDLMRRIVQSEPVTVYASGGQAQNHMEEGYEDGIPDILDHAMVIVEFANGVRASLDLCMFAEDEQCEHVTAVCERGKVEAKSPESTVRVLQRRTPNSNLGREPPAPEQRAIADFRSLPVRKELAEAGYHEGATFYELDAFVNAAKGLREAPVTARDGKLAVAMGVAAQSSIELGRVVRIPETVTCLSKPPLSNL